MVKKLTTFTTTDRKEFDNEADAVAHESIITLKNAFESARREYVRALAKREKTIDGYPFEMAYHTYYYIQTFTGMPHLAEVDFRHDWEFTLNERDKIVILQPRLDGGGYTHSHISSLYHDRKNAQKALVALQAEWLRKQAKMLGVDLGLKPPAEGDAVLGGASC
jgi:hypothetical protein